MKIILQNIRHWVFPAFTVVLLGCTQNSIGNNRLDDMIEVHEPRVSETLEGPDSAPSQLGADAGSGEVTQRTEIFEGTGEFSREADLQLPAIRSDGDGVSLAFREADIATVVSAILGDTLGLSFQIDPDVSGTITLQSSQPVSPGALLYSLEAALRLQNLALIEFNGTYRVIPMSRAPRSVAAINQPRPSSVELPGFSVQIVPLRYTSAREMRTVLEPFAPQDGIIRVDETRNMLVIAGTSQEMANMLQTIETFDLDWLEGMSFALFRPDFVEAGTLTDELLQIFGDVESPIAGLIRLVPIPRLNAILGVSPRAKYLREVETWIARLDSEGGTPGRRLYVYNVRNGRAIDLAAALGGILGSTGGFTQNRSAGPSPLGTTAGPTTRTLSGNRPGFGQPGAGVPAGQFGTTSGQRGQPASPGPSQSSVFEAGGLRIMSIEENNSLLILASPSEYGVMFSALQRLDIRPRQVLIEASLVEVSLTEDMQFGVQWFFETGDNTFTLSESSGGGIASQFPGFSYVYAGSANARAVLNALASTTDVNLISSPKIMVLNNQAATLQVGDQVPVATQAAVSVNDSSAPIVNTVQFRDTGVIMSVTPRINEGGLVMLDITQEVSDVVATTTSGIDSPTIQQRKITSSVVVQDGDTIALGGLIRESISQGRSGIPFLQRIPILGNAFRNNTESRRRTELIILITPRIAQDAGETRAILDHLGEEFRNVMRFNEPG